MLFLYIYQILIKLSGCKNGMVEIKQKQVETEHINPTQSCFFLFFLSPGSETAYQISHVGFNGEEGKQRSDYQRREREDF